MSLLILDGGAAAGVEYDVTVNDAVAVTDSISTAVSYSLSVAADTTTVTDSVTRTLSGVIYSETISDTMSVTDSATGVLIRSAIAVMVSDSISVTDVAIAVISGGSSINIKFSTVPIGLSSDFLAAQFKVALQKQRLIPLQFADDITSAYEKFAMMAIPSPVLAGRRMMYMNILTANMLSGTKIGMITGLVQGFIAYWTGVPLAPAGVVTGVVGIPILTASLIDKFLGDYDPPTAAKKLADCLSAATLTVSYVIPPGTPGFLI